MPPRADHEHQPRIFATGDVVWVHIKSLPWWPGQVMDQSLATAKMKEHKRLHTKLINTFGDNQYCWAFPHDIAMFEEKAEVLSEQRIASPFLRGNFKKALEEAKQLLAMRAGQPTETDHRVIDFLKPLPEDPDPAPEEASPAYISPQVLGPEDSNVDVQEAIDFIRRLALDPDQGVENENVSARLLHTWRCQKYSMPEDLVEPRKRRRKERQSSLTPGPAKKQSPAKVPAKIQAKPEQKHEAAAAEKEEEEEEEEEEQVSEPEEEISDVDADEPDQIEESSESDLEEETAEPEPVAKRQRRSYKPASVELTEDNQWLGLQRSDPADFLRSFRRMGSDCTAPLQDLKKVIACGYLVREQLFSRSVWNQGGKLGELAYQAEKAFLQLESLKPVSKKKKEAAGIPVAKPKIGMSAVSRKYEDRIPQSSADFIKLLEGFYDQHGKTVAPPIVDGVLLDLESVFRAVAARGGNEAVTVNKQWPAIGREWREDVSRAGMSLMHKKYIQHLLAFELDFSKGAPESTVYPTSKASRKDQVAVKAARIAKHVKDIPMKRPKLSKPSVEKAKVVAKQPRATADKSENVPASKQHLAEVDPFANISSEDDEPYMRRNKRPVATRDVSPSQQRRLAKIAKGNITRKSELNQDSFKSLLSDEDLKSSKAKEKVAVKDQNKAASSQGAAANIPSAKPKKPLSEQKVVIRIKFAQGVEMPSRQRLSKEMRNFGRLEDTQLHSKQNTYTFRFDTEQSASRAFAVLDRKACVLLKLPKDSISVFQEHQARHNPNPSKPNPNRPNSLNQKPYQPSSALNPKPVRPQAAVESQRPAAPASASLPRPLNQSLKGIMKHADKPAQASRAPPATTATVGVDPRQMAGIPRGVHPSAPRAPAQPHQMPPRAQEGIATGPPWDYRPPMEQRPPMDPRQMQGNPAELRPFDPRQSSRPAAPSNSLPAGPPPPHGPPAGPADPRQAQVHMQPNHPGPPMFHAPMAPQHHPIPIFRPHSHPMAGGPAGPPPSNPMQHDPRQMDRPDMHVGPSMPMQAQPPQFQMQMQQHIQPPQLPPRPPARPQPPQVQPQAHPQSPPAPTSNKDTAAELTLKLGNMDPRQLASLFQSLNPQPTSTGQQDNVNSDRGGGAQPNTSGRAATTALPGEQAIHGEQSHSGPGVNEEMKSKPSVPMLAGGAEAEQADPNLFASMMALGAAFGGDQ